MWSVEQNLGMSLVIEGWFDSDLIPLPDPLPVVSAFLAINVSDHWHPQHDHEDPVAADVDFLVLAVVVAATLRRLGIRRPGGS
jgi:hypothetical protein